MTDAITQRRYPLLAATLKDTHPSVKPIGGVTATVLLNPPAALLFFIIFCCSKILACCNSADIA